MSFSLGAGSGRPGLGLGLDSRPHHTYQHAPSQCSPSTMSLPLGHAMPCLVSPCARSPSWVTAEPPGHVASGQEFAREPVHTAGHQWPEGRQRPLRVEPEKPPVSSPLPSVPAGCSVPASTTPVGAPVTAAAPASTSSRGGRPPLTVPTSASVSVHAPCTRACVLAHTQTHTREHTCG